MFCADILSIVYFTLINPQLCAAVCWAARQSSSIQKYFTHRNKNCTLTIFLLWFSKLIQEFTSQLKQFKCTDVAFLLMYPAKYSHRFENVQFAVWQLMLALWYCGCTCLCRYLPIQTRIGKEWFSTYANMPPCSPSKPQQYTAHLHVNQSNSWLVDKWAEQGKEQLSSVGTEEAWKNTFFVFNTRFISDVCIL